MPDQTYKYLDPAALGRLKNLPMAARRVVEGFFAGHHRSPLKGFSIEFAEHREYTPGVDPRHLDWRVLGKRDKLYVKQYEEETSLRCYLLLDKSASMGYRTDRARLTKLEYASYLAASLGYLMACPHDAVGLMTFDNQVRDRIFKVGDNPAVVMAYQNYGGGKVMTILADTTWKWSRTPRLVGRSDTLYARFWSQTVRWLAGRGLDENRPLLTVSTDRAGSEAGKPVTVRVTRQPRPDVDFGTAELVAEAKGPNGEVKLPLAPSSANPDEFTALFTPPAGGRYEIAARLFAALVEENHPTLRNRLINALQLGRGNQDGHSPVLIERIVGDAADATAKTDLLRLDDTAEDRKPAAAFAPPLKCEALIRAQTNQLARAMEADGVPLRTMVQELDDLRAGLMAQAVRLFEQGQGSQSAAKADEFRSASLPVQDRIIEQLKAMLARIQKSEQARKAIERMAKTDKPTHAQDPNGATGGGKKSGAWRIGLQGGTRPDVAKDVGRLSEKQMGLREKAEQVARKLEEKGYSTARLREAIELMEPIDADGRDLNYDDLAKKRKEALQKLRGAFGDVDPTAASISRARDLPPEMRRGAAPGPRRGLPGGVRELAEELLQRAVGREVGWVDAATAA